MSTSPFGTRLRAMREARGWTQGYVAQAAGVSRPHLCNIEHGRERPSSELLDSLARTFGLTRTELLKGLRYIHRRSHRHRLRKHAQGLRRAFGYKTPPTPEGKLDVICREAAFYRRGPALIAQVAQQDRPAEHWRALKMFMTWQNGAEQMASLHLLTRGDLEELHPHRTCFLRPVICEPGRSFLGIVIEDDADFIVFHPQLTIVTEKGQTPRLDFLVSLSNGGHPRRVDLEIDGPGHERQMEKDANRPEKIGMPVVRVQVEDLDRPDFTEWVIARIRSAASA